MNGTLPRKQRHRLLDIARSGWDITLASGGHVKLRKAHHLVFTAATPGGGRGDRNLRAQIRRCEAGACQCKARTA